MSMYALKNERSVQVFRTPQGPIDRVRRSALQAVPRTRSIGPCGV
jgi:hypothetical protein